MFEWKDEYILGIVDIDVQHKELFKRINDLRHLFDEESVNGIDKTISEVDKVIEYSIFHLSILPQENSL